MATPAAYPAPSSPAQHLSSDHFWKRFQSDERFIPHQPVITLDREGSVQDMTRAARAQLEYGAEREPDACFFTHVHGRNLRRVMQDLAHMVCHRKTSARWLLRLRTGTGRWRWFRAAVVNHLATPQECIHVRLERI